MRKYMAKFLPVDDLSNIVALELIFKATDYDIAELQCTDFIAGTNLPIRLDTLTEWGMM